MTNKTKKAIDKKLDIIDKALNEIRILMSERDDLKILKTEYDTLLVPRRVSFCEHCGEIREQIGYAEVEIDEYKEDKNCTANVTWCFSCGENCSAETTVV